MSKKHNVPVNVVHKRIRLIWRINCSRWDRYLGMTAAMTQVPVPTASGKGSEEMS